jgi:zinc transporter ZupT
VRRALRYSKYLFSSLLSPIAATALALCSALLSLWLAAARERARIIIPFSAGVLLGVALFGLFPEMVSEIGWPASLLSFAAGYLLVFAVNRYGYPVCPSCSPGHDHSGCTTVLHGFAAPLVAATAVHSFLDGWSIVTAQAAAGAGLRLTVPMAVWLHKIPEGIALGAILWASTGSRPAAFGWCVLAESATILGGAVGFALVPQLGAVWVTYPLAVAGGVFFYLGFHAIHEEWKRRGAAPAFMPALTGAAGAAALQQGVRVLFQ